MLRFRDSRSCFNALRWRDASNRVFQNEPANVSSTSAGGALRSMTKLQELLKELGLQQYAGVLAENDIDFDLLPDLTESDFEKLGLSLGHRRKLVKAVAALRPAPIKEEAPGTSEAQEAGRRQVTVLFSDLVGSTALANEIDPEDMSALIKHYQDGGAV